ncbi:MAG: hypothetical protein PVH18_13500 [Chloroflexota bacterium]
MIRFTPSVIWIQRPAQREISILGRPGCVLARVAAPGAVESRLLAPGGLVAA